MAACCPHGRGCNARDGAELCALEVLEAAPWLGDVSLALARWQAFQECRERDASMRERRFLQRSCRRARDSALIALALKPGAAIGLPDRTGDLQRSAGAHHSPAPVPVAASERPPGDQRPHSPSGNQPGDHERSNGQHRDGRKRDRNGQRRSKKRDVLTRAARVDGEVGDDRIELAVGTGT
jgi:hypothetical protein